MTDESDIVLELDQVSRLYPRDISDTPSAILREMLLPRRFLNTRGPESFFALRDLSLRLHKGHKLGVIGSHLSGKTSLAGIASGIFQPTSGNVSAQGSRLLISRPTAGFKPTLTLIENLRLRARLAGLHSEFLDGVLDRTLSRFGVNRVEAQTPIGNFSPYVVKQLGLTLLLELPADILVVDEVSSAGVGDARWLTRELLQEKIGATTALVISSDFNFIQEVAKEAVLLHHGRLYGPFSVEEAIDHFNELPLEDVLSGLPDSPHDPQTPPTVTSQLHSSLLTADLSLDDDLDHYDHADSEIDDESPSSLTEKSKSRNSRSWDVLGITVDTEEYRHSQLSLIRRPGDKLSVSLEMISLCSQKFSGGRFSLFGGNSGLEVGVFCYESEEIEVHTNQTFILSFDLMVPDWHEDYYGLAFCPTQDSPYLFVKNRIKILIYGVGEKNSARRTNDLQIGNSRFNRNN
jgi:ABC-type polysaccharide/polyol phosphate transport system ATPase subunit